MRDEFIVPAMSRRAVFDVAGMVRALVPNAPAYLDVLHLAEVVLPRHLPDYQFDVVDDEELGGRGGETARGIPYVKISRSTYEGARAGIGRDRFTVAHELGHLFLHSHLGLARSKRPAANQLVKAYQSSEWQADTFGGALLMPVEHFRACADDFEVVRMFGVSGKAALTQRRAYQKEFLL